MPIARRVAVMADLDGLDARQRAALRGVRRFAAEHPHWEVAIDPFAVSSPMGRYDGIIALTRTAVAARQPPEGVPVVAVSHKLWHVRTISRVVPNLRTAGRLAAEHLLRCGFGLHACFGTCPDLEARILREGFVRAMTREHLPPAIFLCNRRSLSRADKWPRVREAMARWVERHVAPPAGVLASSLSLARRLADLLASLGLRIPEDIGLLAAGGEAALAEFPPPALSTLDLGYEQCGERAGEVLEDRMAKGSTVPQRLVLPPGKVVARRSTDVVTWHDPLVQRACRHIADHCGEPGLRVGDVASALGVSVRELQRRFRGPHPLTVAGEIAYARLRRAKRLLLGTELEVREVAQEAGFSSARALARRLREAEGYTPTEFRRVRPPTRRPEEPDLEKAKYLLATTRLPIDSVAYDSGYRRQRYLIEAFHRDVGVTPRTWRKQHRQERPPVPPGPVTVTFIGADGEVEDETTYDPSDYATADEAEEEAERREEEGGTTDEHG